jgi:GT2 family glycosyltransferase
MLRRVGGVRGDYPGAEDHDLLLRLSELISHDRICHVPDLLCHRRTDPLAEDGAPEAAPPTIDAGRRAIADHLARQGLAAQVRSVAGRTWYQVDWGFADEPSACVIIPYRERIDLTRECLQRVLATDYGALEVMLVDNGSTSEAAADFAREAVADPRVRVLRVEEPFNYSRLNNLAARQTGAAYLVLMNNDLHVRDGAWLRVLVNEALADRDVGVVGGKFLYPDGLVQHAGVVTGIGGVACHMNGGIGEHEPGYMGRALIAQELSVVTAACLLVERKLYWDVGGLDEERLKVAFNDVDLCLKAREQGRKVVWAPNFVATHYESASRGADDAPEKAERFHSEVVYMQQRWGSVLRDDPFYSRFFDLESDTAFHDLTDPYQLSDRQMPLPLRYPRRWIHG